MCTIGYAVPSSMLEAATCVAVKTRDGISCFYDSQIRECAAEELRRHPGVCVMADKGPMGKGTEVKTRHIAF